LRLRGRIAKDLESLNQLQNQSFYKSIAIRGRVISVAVDGPRYRTLSDADRARVLKTVGITALGEWRKTTAIPGEGLDIEIADDAGNYLESDENFIWRSGAHDGDSQ